METYNALDIAREFVKIANKNGEFVSHMKLQKLVYFTHAWHLGLTNKPLLNETIRAWQYGPVVPSLYDEYKKFGNQPITLEDSKNHHDEHLSPAVKALVEKIWDLYREFTAFQLSALTHEKGSPWDQVTHSRHNSPGDFSRNVDIPDEKIAAYFAAQKVSING